MNKRTLIMGIAASVFLFSSIGYRVYDGYSKEIAAVNPSIDKSMSSNVSNTNNIKNKLNIIQPPDRGYISQSIESLARQIVENAPNQDEAYAFLIEAKSYRIQELRKRRAKERAEEEKSLYDAELWKRKRKQINAELTKNLEVDSIDTQAGQRRGNFNHLPSNHSNNYKNNNNSSSQNNYSLENLSLNDFVLRAIIKDKGQYIARLGYKDKHIPAKEGYKLFGEIKVESVTSNQVVLSKDKKQIILYAY
ncbi:MAG: hypothetical protein HRT37_15425 [Alteromonadaceae bacterium]|nr:hypothetical protein [Alteromonadaceae bacterium]